MFFLFFTALIAFADPSYGPEPIPEELGKSPHSAYWAGDPEATLKKIFKKLYDVSGYTEPIDLEYRSNERLANNNPLFVRFPIPDELGSPKIFVGYSTFEIFRNEHELAQALAHEMCHVFLDHSKKKWSVLMQFDDWYAKNKKRIDRKIKEMKKQGLSSAKIMEEIHSIFRKEVFFPVVRQHEEEADSEGINLAFLAGFKPAAALNAVIHATEYRSAAKDCNSEVLEECWANQLAERGSLAERHDRLKQILKDLKILDD